MFRYWKQWRENPRLSDAFLIPACIIGAGAAALALGEDVSWDLRNYHFYSGYAFLNKPLHHDFAPAQVQSFFNPLLHVPSYLLLKHFSGLTATFLLGALQGLNFWLVYKICMTLLSGLDAVLRVGLSVVNALVGFYGAANISELGTTFGDNLVSIPMLAVVLYLLRSLSGDGRDSREFYLKPAGAGLLMGIAFGLKLTVGIYLVAVIVALFIARYLGKGGTGPVLWCTLGAALGFAAAYGPWGISLYREYGNPFFPYFNNIFHSEFYPATNSTDLRFMPEGWSQTLFYPFYFGSTNTLASEVEFRDVRLAFLYAILLFTGVYGWAGRSVGAGRKVGPSSGGDHEPLHAGLTFLVVFAVLSYVLWQTAFSIYRYVVLLEFLAPAMISGLILHTFRNRTVAVAVLLCTNLAIAAAVEPMDFGREPFGTRRLDVDVPDLPGLDRSVVLLAGQEAVSYIIPSFPKATRFVRLEANFLRPGLDPELDGKLRGILDNYPPARRYCYMGEGSKPEETADALAHFGLAIDRDSCAAIVGSGRIAGWLCGLSPGKAGASESEGARAVAAAAERPRVLLDVSPTDLVAGRDTLRIRVSNLKARAVDILYSIDGVEMPPVTNWALDEGKGIRVFVDKNTPKGLYRLKGIRSSGGGDDSYWIPIDVRVRVR